MKRFLSLALCLIVILCSCEGNKPVSQSIFAMDTVMQFTLYGSQAKNALSDISTVISEYESTFSPTREDSELLRLNQNHGGTLSPLFTDLLSKSLMYHSNTNGMFDPTLGALISLWKEQKVPSMQDLSIALANSGCDKLSFSQDPAQCHLSSNVSLDLGAIVKGAVSDAIYQTLVNHKVKSGVLSLGGNILAFGSNPKGEPWTIGIRDPDGSASDYLGTISVTDQFVIASGDYERYFEENGVRYHHILDPKTGYPVQNDLRSVVIVSKNATLADAYSTALFVMGSEKALDFWREQQSKGNDAFEVVLILRDHRIIITEGLSSFTQTKEGYTYEVAHR